MDWLFLNQEKYDITESEFLSQIIRGFLIIRGAVPTARPPQVLILRTLNYSSRSSRFKVDIEKRVR